MYTKNFRKRTESYIIGYWLTNNSLEEKMIIISWKKYTDMLIGQYVILKACWAQHPMGCCCYTRLYQTCLVFAWPQNAVWILRFRLSFGTQHLKVTNVSMSTKNVVITYLLLLKVIRLNVIIHTLLVTCFHKFPIMNSEFPDF